MRCSPRPTTRAAPSLQGGPPPTLGPRGAHYPRVRAGVVVTGNEDGAHHVIAETAGSLIDIGFTVPGQSWTYWNMGPGPGPSFLETDEGHDWSRTTAEAAAQNLLSVAR